MEEGPQELDEFGVHLQSPRPAVSGPPFQELN
jgi:hypothetical protein